MVVNNLVLGVFFIRERVGIRRAAAAASAVDMKEGEKIRVHRLHLVIVGVA